MKTKLSVVIATKNREYYCIEAIKSILSYKTEYIELVISDNSNSCKVQEYVHNHPDKRLKYYYTSSPLSVIENYNICLNAATGKYICLIGDDDIILPAIFDVVDFAITNNIEAIGQKDVIDYLWPSDISSGHVRIPKYSNKVLKFDTNKILLRYLKKGGCFNPRDAKLPMLYHGLVKRSLLLKIKDETGEILTGISPDSYSACAIAQRIKVHYIYDTPFTIAGACNSSATIAKLMGGHCGELTESDQYNMNIAKGYIWADQIPKFYSVQTIWADSTLHNMLDHYKENFKLRPLISRALFSNMHIASTIYKYTNKKLNENNYNHMIFYITCYMEIFVIAVNKVFSKIFRTMIQREIRLDGVKHINDVVNLISQ